MKPFFSVIIPVYNKEQYISMTIDSVLKQSFDNFELIIVCDPSTDNSNKEVEKYKNNDKIKIFYRNKPGHGGYAARNLGIKNSNAKWITFLDADDEWYENHLAKIYDSISKYPEQQLFTTAWIDSYENHKENTLFAKLNTDKVILKLDFNDYIHYSIKRATPIHTNTIAIKKELFDTVCLFPENICKRGGDVTTWMQLVKYTNSLICLPDITSVYHRENSTVTKELLPELQDNCIVKVVNLLLEIEDNNKIKNILHKFANYHIRYGLIARIKQGTLKYTDVKYHTYSIDKLMHLFFVISSIMPRVIQQNIFIIAKALKK